MKHAWSRKNLWDNLPGRAKHVVGSALAMIPPASLLGGRFRRALRKARAAQWRSAQWSRAYQVDQLRRVCRIAMRRSPFYGAMFVEAGFDPNDIHRPEDLRQLPMIDRATVNENLEAMRTTSARWPWVDEVTTAGTSGSPLRFYAHAGRSSVEYAYLVASWERIGYRLGVPVAVLRGRVVQRDRHGLHHQYDPILRLHWYSSFHMSDFHMDAYLRHMDGLGRFFLHGYPSTVAVLARYIRRSGRAAPKGIAGIILESEIVYPQQRKMIERAFGCRSLACYGHSEKLVLGVECDSRGRYHIWPTYGYCELVDPAGQPVTEAGAVGEIVGTGFLNTVVPFIRYRTGDYAVLVDTHCEFCGREHMVLTDIRGHRTQESLIANNGDEIPWTAVNMHDDTFAHVRQFQFAQDTPGEAVLRIVPADGFGGDDRSRIERNLGTKLNGRIAFNIEIVDTIALTSVGKTVYVEQRIVPALVSGEG